MREEPATLSLPATAIYGNQMHMVFVLVVA
jgi:hypothetical protein